MGRRSNQALKAKRKLAMAQAAAFAQAEYSKPAWQGNGTLAAANARREELAALVAAWSGTVRELPPAPYRDFNRQRGGCVLGQGQPSVALPASIAASNHIVGAINRNAGVPLRRPDRLIQQRQHHQGRG